MPENKIPAWKQLAEEARQRSRDVPADLVAIAVEAMEDDAHEHCNEDGCPGNTQPFHESQARQILADLLPAHEAMVRQQIAREIEDTIGQYPDNEVTRPKVETGLHLNDWQWAARIARGGEDDA